MSKNTYRPTSFTHGDTYNERTDRFNGVNLTDPQFLVDHSRGVAANNYVLQPTGRVETRDGFEQISEGYYVRGVWDFVCETGDSVRLALYCQKYQVGGATRYNELIGSMTYLHDGKYVDFFGTYSQTLITNVSSDLLPLMFTPAHAVSSNNRLYVLTGHGFYVVRVTGPTNADFDCTLVREFYYSHIPTTRYMGIARNVATAPTYNNVTLEYPNLLNPKRTERYLLGIDLMEDNFYPAISLGAKVATGGFEFARLTVDIETLDDDGKAVDTIHAMPVRLKRDDDDLSGNNAALWTWLISSDVYSGNATPSALAKFYIDSLEAGDYLLVSDKVALTDLLQASTASTTVKPILRGPYTKREYVSGTREAQTTVTTNAASTTGTFDFGIYLKLSYITFLRSLGASSGTRAEIMSEFYENSELTVIVNNGGGNSTTYYDEYIKNVFILTTGGWGMTQAERTNLTTALTNAGVDPDDDDNNTSIVCSINFSNGNVNERLYLSPAMLYNATGIAISREGVTSTGTSSAEFGVVLDFSTSIASALQQIVGTITSTTVKDSKLAVQLTRNMGAATVELLNYGEWSNNGALLINDVSSLVGAAYSASGTPGGSDWDLVFYNSDVGTRTGEYVSVGIPEEDFLAEIFQSGEVMVVGSSNGTSLSITNHEDPADYPGWNEVDVITNQNVASSATLTDFSDWVNTYTVSGTQTGTSTTTENVINIDYDNALIIVNADGTITSRNEYIVNGTGTNINHCCVGVLHQTENGSEIYFFKNFKPKTLYTPNVTITYPTASSSSADYVKACSIIDKATNFALFGANNSLNRLWVYGNPDMPNYAIHSQEPYKGFSDNVGLEEGDFTYFPDEGMIKFGEAENAIVGMNVVSTDSMAVIKNHHGKDRTMFFVSPTYVSEQITDTDAIIREEYKTSLSNTSTAGLSKNAFADVNGDLLFVSKDKKVVGLDIEGITGDSQRVANTRSYYIDGVLNDADFDNVHLFTYQDKIYLSLDDKLYCSALNSKSSDTGQYDWWPCDPFPSPILSVNVLKDALWVGTTDGKVYTLRKPTDEDPETCDITRIYCNDATGVHTNFSASGVMTVDAGIAEIATASSTGYASLSTTTPLSTPIAHYDSGLGYWVADDASFLKNMGSAWHNVIIGNSDGSTLYKAVLKVAYEETDEGETIFSLYGRGMVRCETGGSNCQYAYVVLGEADLSTRLRFSYPCDNDDTTLSMLIGDGAYVFVDADSNVIVGYLKGFTRYEVEDGVTKVFAGSDPTDLDDWLVAYRYHGEVDLSGLSGFSYEADDFDFYSFGAENTSDSFDANSYSTMDVSFNAIAKRKYLYAIPNVEHQTLYAYSLTSTTLALFESEQDFFNKRSSLACIVVSPTKASVTPNCYYEYRTPIVPQFASIRLAQAKIGYDKTVQNVTVWNDSKNPCELFVGALTNKNYVVADDNKVFDSGLGLNFGDVSFEHTDFDKNEVPRLYNLKKFPRNQQTLTITFTASGKRNSVLAGLDILYHIKPAKNKR